jgi:hypothetical protein
MNSRREDVMKRKREERRKRRRLKFRTLFMLSLTLIFNTYAWFLYVTTVSTNMQVHVDAWSVNFAVDGNVVEKEFLYEIEHAYPGMEDINKTITINNSGEKKADLTYKISKVRIINDVYVVEDELTAEEQSALDGTEIKVTSEELIDMLENDFPFKIIIESSSNELEVNGEATVSVSFTWAYDNNNDELDTQYGVDSYKYYQENDGDSAIEATIKIKAQQHNGN